MRTHDVAPDPQPERRARPGGPASPSEQPEPPALFTSTGDSARRSASQSPGHTPHRRPDRGVRALRTPTDEVASEAVEAFSRQARLACRALGVPIAQVVLVGPDGGLRGQPGGVFPSGWNAQQAAAWRSFCSRAADAAQAGEPLLVADLRAQPWYREQTADGMQPPGDGDPELAACAAAPLAGADGHTLGAFCAGDIRPRLWEQDDVETLRDLAATAAQHLGLRVGMVERDQQAQAVAASALEQVEAIAGQLGQQAAALDTIIEAIPDGVYICDANGNRTRVNAHGAAMLGLSPAQALAPIAAYKATNKPRYPDGTPMPVEELPLARALRGETRTDIRFAVTQYGTGREVQLLACCAPIRNAAGEITGGVTVCTDVTELTRLERQKDDFLSIASHEMKTPMTSLKILTQLTRRRLERAGLVESEHLARMERAILRMERLVNDLVDVSRIDAGWLPLRLERCELAHLCRQSADEQSAAAERAISLDLPEGPVWVTADAERMGQVLTNLLSNALKYSAQNCPVGLALRVESERALLTVRDEGAGIPPESLPHLFERFYRVPGVQVQSGSGVGMGLGLFIAREIVERHGGAIEVQSAVGQGTTFTVTLPLARDA